MNGSMMKVCNTWNNYAGYLVSYKITILTWILNEKLDSSNDCLPLKKRKRIIRIMYQMMAITVLSFMVLSLFQALLVRSRYFSVIFHLKVYFCWCSFVSYQPKQIMTVELVVGNFRGNWMLLNPESGLDLAY